jgi:hypothetical protein
MVAPGCGDVRMKEGECFPVRASPSPYASPSPSPSVASLIGAQKITVGDGDVDADAGGNDCWNCRGGARDWIRGRGEPMLECATMAKSWSDSEPGYFALRSEVARLSHRARRRSGLVLLATAATTVVAVLFAWQSPHNHVAVTSIRLTEVVDYNLPRSQWTNLELLDRVTKVALTNAVLLEVYNRFVRPREDTPNPARGVERLRDALGVKVVRNRIVPVEDLKTPRSAYVVLTYESPFADEALGVVSSLTAPIVESSTRRRRGETAQEVTKAQLALKEARRVLQEQTDQALARAGTPLRGSGSASSVQLLALDKAVTSAQQRVGRLQTELMAAERLKREENSRPGIDFEIAESRVDPPLPLLPLLLTVAIVGFFLALPVMTMLVGAFSPFIESVEDIRRLGIPSLGRLVAGGGRRGPAAQEAEGSAL